MGVESDDWNSHWAAYAGAASKNPAQRMRHREIVSTIKRGPGTQPLQIFDIGSGQGDLLVQLRAAFPEARLLGAELSREGVAISRRKVPGAMIVEADLYQTCPELEPFREWATHAVCSEVLEHVDTPVEFLRRSGAYLKPNALLTVTVPGGPMSAFDRHIGHRQHFTRDSAARMVASAGYRVQGVRMAGFPFFNLYRLTVILRGRRLIRDVESKGRDGSSGAASIAMRIFHALFCLNQRDSRLGWQVLLEARKL